MVRTMSGKQVKYARRMLRRNKYRVLDEFLNEIAGFSFKTRLGFAWHILRTKKRKTK